MSYEDMSRKEILEDYTTVMNNITEHINSFPERTMASKWEVYCIWETEEWLEKLKIIVGGKQ